MKIPTITPLPLFETLVLNYRLGAPPLTNTIHIIRSDKKFLLHALAGGNYLISARTRELLIRTIANTTKIKSLSATNDNFVITEDTVGALNHYITSEHRKTTIDKILADLEKED